MFTQWLVADRNSNCLVPHNMAPRPLLPSPHHAAIPSPSCCVFIKLLLIGSLLSAEPTLAATWRRLFWKRPRLLDWKEIQVWHKHLPFSCHVPVRIPAFLLRRSFSKPQHGGNACWAHLVAGPAVLGQRSIFSHSLPFMSAAQSKQLTAVTHWAQNLSAALLSKSWFNHTKLSPRNC